MGTYRPDFKHGSEFANCDSEWNRLDGMPTTTPISSSTTIAFTVALMLLFLPNPPDQNLRR